MFVVLYLLCFQNNPCTFCVQQDHMACFFCSGFHGELGGDSSGLCLPTVTVCTCIQDLWWAGQRQSGFDAQTAELSDPRLQEEARGHTIGHADCGILADRWSGGDIRILRIWLIDQGVWFCDKMQSELQFSIVFYIQLLMKKALKLESCWQAREVWECRKNSGNFDSLSQMKKYIIWQGN